jgi:hypothetical protein
MNSGCLSSRHCIYVSKDVRIRTCLSKPRVAREHKSLGNAPPDVTPLDFCLWGCKKSETDKIKVGTRDEMLARIFDAAARIHKSEDKLRRTIRIFAH